MSQKVVSDCGSKGKKKFKAAITIINNKKCNSWILSYNSLTTQNAKLRLQVNETNDKVVRTEVYNLAKTLAINGGSSKYTNYSSKSTDLHAAGPSLYMAIY